MCLAEILCRVGVVRTRLLGGSARQWGPYVGPKRRTVCSGKKGENSKGGVEESTRVCVEDEGGLMTPKGKG